MSEIIRKLAKTSFAIIIALFLEGVITFGSAFQIENYNFFGYLFQSCVLILCIYAGQIEWE